MEVLDRIRSQLSEHPIVLYLKGTPHRPTCQGSLEASRALEACGAPYLAVDIQGDPEVRATLPKYSDWPGFPQLFIQGEFIGGSEVIHDLHAQGELARMVESVALPRASNQ